MDKSYRLYFGNNSIKFGCYTYPQIGIAIETDDGIKFCLNFILNLYIRFRFKKIQDIIYRKRWNGKQISLGVSFGKYSNFRIFGNLFTDKMESNKGDISFSFYPFEAFKGQAKVSKIILESRNILIPLPEKSYEATAILADWVWEYPRWFSKTIRRCEIDIPGGIPHKGKGENAWDCGDDATFGVTTGICKSIPEAVGNLVGDTLLTRVKRGGYADWSWNK